MIEIVSQTKAISFMHGLFRTVMFAKVPSLISMLKLRLLKQTLMWFRQAARAKLTEALL